MPYQYKNFHQWPVLLILLACLVVIQFAAAAEVVVHVQTGSSIQTAIDHTPAGGTIQLGPGTWHETLKIDKPIVIRGQGMYQTIIAADQPGHPVLWISPANWYQTASVTISNLIITGAIGGCAAAEQNLYADGILVQGSATVIVNGCAIAENGRHGLCIVDNAHVTVNDSVFTDNYTGIWLSSSASVDITRDTLSANTYGVVIADYATAKVTDCTISENTKDGMIIADAAQVVLIDNNITGNKRTGISIDVPPCYDTSRSFSGLIIGEGNTIPGSSADQGNAFPICPPTLSFLSSRDGGFYPAESAESILSRLPTLPPMEGNTDAPVTIIEFTDFTCPYCSKFTTETLPRIEAAYIDTGNAKLYFLPFPVHGIVAYRTAEAGFCAHEQGLFWDFQRLLTAQYNVRGSSVLTPAWLATIAAAVGGDRDKFLKSITSGTYAEAVKETVALGKELGVDGTPTFFINGRKIPGAAPYEVFAQMIEEELAHK
ncbi:MAG: thioredoxin domain-containing protein [Candidatus Bipolaricaulota bacterium]|nr:thioredoxin domain-containing protein [Candidatus Bipolaricaulota bacterium]